MYAGVRNDKDSQSIKNEGIPNLRPLLLDVAKEVRTARHPLARQLS